MYVCVCVYLVLSVVQECSLCDVFEWLALHQVDALLLHDVRCGDAGVREAGGE